MYRSFFYYYQLALFVCSLFFVQVISLSSHNKFSEKKSEQKNSLQNHQNIDEENYIKPAYQLIEILDEGNYPDLSRSLFLGTKNSKGKNQSYSQDLIYQSANSQNKENEASEKEIYTDEKSFLQELQKSKQDIITGKQKKNINPKLSLDISKNLKSPDSQYFKGSSVRKLHMQMNQNGDFSVNAMEFEGAEYLISVAKSIFNYWVDFIPAEMVSLGFIKTDDIGIMQSILLFSLESKKGSKYNVSFIKPFLSPNLNQSTLNAFSYYNIPMNNKIKIDKIAVEFKIYRDTMSISANFEFQLVKS